MSKQTTMVLYVLLHRFYSKERPFFRISRSFLRGYRYIERVFGSHAYFCAIEGSFLREDSSESLSRTCGVLRGGEDGTLFDFLPMPKYVRKM